MTIRFIFILNKIVDLFRSDDTNPWYGKLAVVGACAVGIYVVVIDPPLKIAMACAAGIMGTLAAIKVGEACYNYCMETNTQEGLELVGDGIHLHQD